MTRDVWSTTAADAAIAEQLRGQVEDGDSRPDAAEVRRDMAGLVERPMGCACRRVDCAPCRAEQMLTAARLAATTEARRLGL